jgi:ubiquinone/menaquinone biosynthesis C-methylase UbiE
MNPADLEKAVQRQFGRQALCYATSQPHATGSSLQVMVNWARPRTADRVIDIATGAGFTAFAFAEAGAEVVATDLTMKMLHEARRLAAERAMKHVRFLQAAAEALPFRSGSFDIATCRIAPHHFASVPNFLEEVRRVLRPTGRFVVTDTSSPEEPDLYAWQQELQRLRDPSHVRTYTPSQWRELVAEAGFILEEMTTAHRSELVFSDWMHTAGSPPEVVAALRRRFVEAPPAIRDAVRLREVGDDFHFSFMLVILLARPA